MPGIIRGFSEAESMNQLAVGEVQVQNVQPTKRLKTVKRFIRHKQPYTEAITDSIQDESVSQKQLLRSIALALSAQGYDEALPSALEEFRAQVESLKHSMISSRRQAPTPHDFTTALAAFSISPSDLLPHTSISPHAHNITQPHLRFSPPESKQHMITIDDMFPPTQAQASRKYVPKHLPPLPSPHTYQMTAVIREREIDPLKIRERATQEGVMAERALRRLMAMSEVQKQDGKEGESRRRLNADIREDDEDAAVNRLGEWTAMIDGARKSDEEARDRETRLDDDDEDEMQIDGDHKPTTNKHLEVNMESNLAVNYDRGHWRALGRGRTG